METGLFTRARKKILPEEEEEKKKKRQLNTEFLASQAADTATSSRPDSLVEHLELVFKRLSRTRYISQSCVGLNLRGLRERRKGRFSGAFKVSALPLSFISTNIRLSLSPPGGNPAPPPPYTHTPPLPSLPQPTYVWQRNNSGGDQVLGMKNSTLPSQALPQH